MLSTLEAQATAFAEQPIYRRADIADELQQDLSREVFGIFGVPVDCVDIEQAVSRLERAAIAGKPFILSTPNLQFLNLSQWNARLRESLLMSDLCTADGMPLVWLAKLLGIPLPGRITGSDIFDVLKGDRPAARPLKVFLFGGTEGLPQFVARRINAQSKQMICVGAIAPGFGSVEEMSSESTINAINASGADFLTVFLSAPKGQDWLLRNHDRLTIPIRSHLGATINFQAGTVRRAPRFMRTTGLEWLWRIKEEPFLWRRYWRDGWALLRLVMFRALPLLWTEAQSGKSTSKFEVTSTESHGVVTIGIRGPAVRANVAKLMPVLKSVVSSGREVAIDLTSASAIDPRFFGLLVVLRKVLKRNGRNLSVRANGPRARRLFKLHNFEFLLDLA